MTTPSSGRRPRGRSRHWWLLGGLAAAAIVAALVALVATGHVWPARPAAEVAFVDGRSCVECHQAEARAWAGSPHDRAMQVADDRTVLGDFDDARLTHLGVTSRFFRREGKFLVNTEGPDGRPADFEVRYTFGVEPLQQYLIEFPGGRLQSLTIAWDTRARRWFSLYPGERIRPGDPLHWTGRYQNWNLMCAECHSTNLRKAYDPETDSYATRWSEINVGCQACHGPGEAHVAWARRARGRGSIRDATMGLVVLRSVDWRQDVDRCGRCHARRTPLGAVERQGRPFLDEYRPSWLRAELYHPDGQQLDEVYEWGSYLQSRMYQVGVRCTDCHDPHRADRSGANAVCTRCHREAGDARFPTLKARNYDSPEHHFHGKPGSAGALCVSCHMAVKTYMVVDPRRDHSIRIPRPDLTMRLGTPNACNDCHRDRSARWSAAAVEKWYGKKPPAPHYGETIAAGRARARDAGPRLAALAGAVAQPAIVRATALDLLRDYGPPGLAAMRAATADQEPLVRLAATAGLDGLPPEERVGAVAPLLRDPIRAVRIEAARVLAGVPPASFTAAQREGFDAALAEFLAAQRAMADMPSSRLNLGVVQANLGQRAEAERSYRTALRMDPHFYPARANLVAMLSETGRNADAERVLRDGLALTPDHGELHYSLGLLLAEQRRMEEAAETLARAARLLPDRARVLYNHALALQHLGRRQEAEAALLQAQALDPGDPQIVYALTVFFAQQRQYRRALPYAERLAELAPGDQGARQLLERLRAQVGAGAPGRD